MVKYFFQFGFFPWNKNVELNKDKPYHPPNIIGVEKKDAYVLYDLIQLLALFFHRSILKVLPAHQPWAVPEHPALGSHCPPTSPGLSPSTRRWDCEGLGATGEVCLCALVFFVNSFVHLFSQHCVLNNGVCGQLGEISPYFYSGMHACIVSCFSHV